MVDAHLAIPGRGGMLLVQPPPAEVALDAGDVERWIAEALEAARARGVRGGAVTPYLLSAVARASGGRTLAANIGLIVNNARTAARIAVARGRQRGTLIVAVGGVSCPRIGGSVRGRLLMRIYEGSPRQDWEEVLRAIGAFADRERLKELLFLELEDGFLLQGMTAPESGAWSESSGQLTKRTYELLDDQVGHLIDEAAAHRGTASEMHPHVGITNFYEQAMRVMGAWLDGQRPQGPVPIRAGGLVRAPNPHGNVGADRAPARRVHEGRDLGYDRGCTGTARVRVGRRRATLGEAV